MAADDESSSVLPGRTAAIFTASPLPTAITRAADGRILFANSACEEMLGRSPDGSIVGRTMVEAGFWTDPGQRTAMLSELAREGFVRDREQQLTLATGETRTVLTTIARIELDGQACLVGHLHDVTGQRRLEEQLRESEARFRQVTETIQQGFLLRNVDPPRVLYASPAVGRIFGVDLDAIYGDAHALQALIHPDDRDDVVARRDAMVAAADFEFRILRPDGEPRWVRTRAEPVRGTEGQPQRIVAVSEDVTAERALREALRASEERFRLLAENATDVIGRLSPDGRIMYISPACRTVYGYEPDAMVGRFGFEFVHPDDVAELRDDLAARVADRGVITNSYRVEHGAGGIVWVEANIRAIHNSAGELVEFHTVARDVSERMVAQEAVRRAKEEAERANAAKSDFLSRMSHELRTPLHAILGFGELLERERLLPHQRDELKQITRGGQHLLELINEVLDLSRIERGELRLSVEPVHVGQVVAETIELLCPLADARSVKLPAARLEDHDVHVLADRQRLKQVLLNLLSNAVKYNREGGEVRVETTFGGGPDARVEVTDTGIGIAAHDLARAFDAFERLGAETTDVEGTGLGLALTKRLMEAMGGSVSVASEVGRGTTFELVLPVAEHPAAEPAARAAGAQPAPAARSELRSVLYIEDNPSNVQLVEAILRKRPEVTLVVAQQASLGLDLARERRPALVLLDLNLPDMSGEEVLRRLRSDARTRDLKVVVLSADATSERVARLRGLGADGYLPKPFAIDQFLALVDGAAAPEAAGAPAAAAAAPEGGPLDPTTLARLLQLDPGGDAVAELIDVFLQDSAERLEALAAATREGDTEAVCLITHAWRGASSMAGAVRLTALLADIETLARVGTVPGDDELAAVRHAHDEAAGALRKLRR